MTDNEVVEKNLKSLLKNINKRGILWIMYGAGVVLLNISIDNFYYGVGLSMIGLSVLTLIDEKLKEGYFFDAKDLRGKSWRHEKLVV